MQLYYLITNFFNFLREYRKATFQNPYKLLRDKGWKKCVLHDVPCLKTLIKQSISGRHWSTYIHCINLSATHLSTLIHTGSVIYKKHFYGLYIAKDKTSEAGSGADMRVGRRRMRARGWIWKSEVGYEGRGPAAGYTKIPKTSDFYTKK